MFDFTWPAPPTPAPTMPAPTEVGATNAPTNTPTIGPRPTPEPTRPSLPRPPSDRGFVAAKVQLSVSLDQWNGGVKQSFIAVLVDKLAVAKKDIRITAATEMSAADYGESRRRRRRLSSGGIHVAFEIEVAASTDDGSGGESPTPR